MGWRWPAAGPGALSVAVHAWDLLKEVAIILITSTHNLKGSHSVMSDFLQQPARLSFHGILQARVLEWVAITIVWPQVKNREGTQPHPSTENWIKDLLSILKLIKTRPFPPQSVCPIRKLPQTSYPSPSEGRQTENHKHRKQSNLITWITALSKSMKL